MKILLSPAKTIKINNNKGVEPIFNDKTLHLLDLLQKFSKQEISSIMKIKNKILDATYENIQNYNENKCGVAIESYDGMVYKNLNYKSLQNKNYILENVIILDSFYGLLTPSSLIKNYRLDFKMKLGQLNLYKYWEEEVNDYLQKVIVKQNEVLISLASKEFEKLIKIPFTSVAFRTYKDGKYKNIATHSKTSRGKLLI